MLCISLRESWGLESVGDSKGIAEWETGLEEIDVDCFLTVDGSLGEARREAARGRRQGSSAMGLRMRG
eukprot:248293-Hanusia_phi.AAC.1